MTAAPLVELTRGGAMESVHAGHAVICTADGAVHEGWGNPNAAILPRSSAKMLQALPLLESAAGRDLPVDRVALACASHVGSAIHTSRVRRWLTEIGLDASALLCGPQDPSDRDAAQLLALTGTAPDAAHNNCSGKHTGFLALAQALGAGPDYIDIDHPVQRAIRSAWQEETGDALESWGIDGCSAPNFRTSLRGLATAMARFATAGARSGVRATAQVRLTEAMMARPDLVEGRDKAATLLMRALAGRGAAKSGAEGVFVAILPGPGLGVAVKVADGAARGAQAAMAGLLVQLGCLEPDHPAVLTLVGGDMTNRSGRVTGQIRFAPQANASAE